MLAALGDLVEDIVVHLGGPVRVATDTEAHIERRRGGSAANVAVAAAGLGHPARFLGQVGDDPAGKGLLDEMAGLGIDVSRVRTGGHTGTIVVLVDEAGERTMLTDRRSCAELASPEPSWLDGVDALHIPMYSFATGLLAASAVTVVGWAHDRRIPVSIDVSSVALIDELGVDEVRALLRRLQPEIVLANADEAVALDLDGPIGSSLTIVKQGADPAIVHRPGSTPVAVPAIELDRIVDSTGAGDAFAAGLLAAGPARWREDPVGACRAGHAAAADLLGRRNGRS